MSWIFVRQFGLAQRWLDPRPVVAYLMKFEMWLEFYFGGGRCTMQMYSKSFPAIFTNPFLMEAFRKSTCNMYCEIRRIKSIACLKHYTHVLNLIG